MLIASVNAIEMSYLLADYTDPWKAEREYLVLLHGWMGCKESWVRQIPFFSRDFAVLARHLQKHPGVLNIRHGEVPAELYKARVVGIAAKLKQAGISPDRVSISDGMPGGTGISSERIVRILTEKPDEPARETTEDSGRITQ